jgi:adenosylcobinamide-GDP ribazoletransferase
MKIRGFLATPLRDLRVCLGFLTRFPAGGGDVEAGALARGAWAFPLVGVALGGLAGAACFLGLLAGLPPLLAAILAIAVLVFSTGALHEDGLADVADGFGGGRDREAKLVIMRDSRIGAYGVIALVLSLLARIGALAAIAEPAFVASALIVSESLSRAAMVPAMGWLPAARDDGLATRAGQPGRTAIIVALALAALVAGIVAGPFHMVLMIAAAVLAGSLVGLLAWRQIGGRTGDVLGAVQQAVAVITLALAAALANG